MKTLPQATHVPLPLAGGVRGGPVGSTQHNKPSPDPSRKREGRLWIASFAALLLAAPLAAQDSLPPAPYAYRQLDDPALEAKAHALMQTLRCLKCQSQSIADSDAPMAGDMRSQVRERIAQGEDPEAIRAWLIERYGDYVSYEPRVTSLTWPLFVAPVAFLVLALLLVRRRFMRGGEA